MSKKSLLRGAMWGTIAVFLSKVLGFIYLVPFNKILVPATEQIIFTSAYRIYAYVLLIATAGIPFATAHIIAKYNAHKNYIVSFKILRINTIIMFFIGLVCTILLFIFADLFANIIVTNSSDKNIISNVATGIRLVSTALIFVPILSVTRGFFQGYKEIKISSMSQLLEQLINSGFILAALLLAGIGFIDNILAVYFACFCATLASLGSLVYLVYYFIKLDKMFNSYIREGNKYKTNKNISSSILIKEILMISIPYISVILLAQSNDLIDLFYTVRGLVANKFSLESAKDFAALYGANINKLLTIPLTISMGLSVALVPHLSESLAIKDYKSLQSLITKILQGTLVVLIPVVVLMMALRYEIFFVISGGSDLKLGPSVFNYFAIYAIINTFTIIIDNMMLTLNQRKRALVFIASATLFKLLSTFLLIQYLGIFGLALSSIIACLISTIPSMIVLKNTFKLKYHNLFRTAIIASVLSFMMYVVIEFIAHSIQASTYLTIFIELICLGIMGTIIYILLALRLNIIPTEIKNRFLARFLK